MQGALAKEREFYNNRHTTRVVLQNERACVNRYALTYCLGPTLANISSFVYSYIRISVYQCISILVY